MKSRKRPIYENCRVLDIDGQLLFTCSRRRLQQYIKGGATIISDDVIRLNFKAAGPGSRHDPFAIAFREDRCVACGSTDWRALTQHHIVPRCYRRRMPDNFKKHNHHDVVPVCRRCHQQYEAAAQKLKEDLSVKYNAPIDGLRETNLYTSLSRAVKSARAIAVYGGGMSPERIRVLKNRIIPHLGHEPSDAEIQDLSTRVWIETTRTLKHHGKIVIEQVMQSEGIQAFVEMWRRHFLDTMQPRFMPEHWDLHRPADRRTNGSF